MGMDVYGRNPSSEKGEYFRNNVWYWHPLWEYCQINHPAICDKVQDGHSNSGDGLNASDSKKLAKLLKKDLESGYVEIYAKDRQKYLDSLEDKKCTYCNGSGIRDDEYVQGTCNGCSGKGTVRPFECSYGFIVENVKEFQEFLEDCGGFNIH